MLMSAEFKGCVASFLHFWDLLYVRYNYAKVHQCRISVTDFRDGGAFCGFKYFKQLTSKIKVCSILITLIALES